MMFDEALVGTEFVALSMLMPRLEVPDCRSNFRRASFAPRKEFPGVQLFYEIVRQVPELQPDFEEVG